MNNLTMEKKIIIGAVVLMLIGLGFFIFNETKPKPGTQLEDLGRTHVPIGTVVEYNSNPPTSGNHYEEWVRAGVYDRPQDDGHLIHSLEHGYVIISYNCAFGKSSSPLGPLEKKTNTEDSTQSAMLTSDFTSDECNELVKNLTSIYDGKGKRKLILVPRPQLDSKIALTSWRYIDKFNDFDKARIEKFIDAHRDHGPEQTME
ncbi:MAG: hypothetical protein ACD_30C00089G0007 [uncultured bacterium]|uniref:DUF3105 domain-containing protein n=3 Tax=Candidatus Daviesiibacteriota TaxID=1752718 RepID=A0A1F5K5U5_9BACT|nr:MAG: hypothetical protein ACD_30C00089G0007 [uncultured bacterium]KKQ16192.1 MAG: hypothetical protein US28_C0004G0034 [Candidatus Daviesbacteria bacterium GW2011_GWA1_36_8]OGE33266.1 MAG: hypothetical protein A3C99_01470 [Candidatus Daviesbacteria bacterium RIFCSPHIGHO2_02_FULL_37_9]OGE36168.1 MAG: hypothetical protein A3E66_05160 [Candidatus Daviesbacteria bacterium RIFCSPHIGHO2_12_FULL_37_16]